MESFDEVSRRRDEDRTDTARWDTFKLDGRGSAEWAMRMLKERQRAMNEIGESRDRIIADAEEWAGEASKGLVSDIEWFTALLKDWAIREHEANPDSKATIALPAGDVKRRTTKTVKAKIEDKEALIGWAEDSAPDLITYTATIVAADLTDLIRRTEKTDIPGVIVVEPGETTYTVTVKQDEQDQ